jgi:hypothetical protein
MSEAQVLRTGGCACGAVRFRTLGEPDRVGLCHCMTCRKTHAAAFYPFVVFAAEQVEVTGQTASWLSSPGYDRRFCPTCGSGVLDGDEREVEISLGSFDEPGEFSPDYECWTVRREPWLPDLGVPQHLKDRGA